MKQEVNRKNGGKSVAKGGTQITSTKKRQRYRVLLIKPKLPQTPNHLLPRKKQEGEKRRDVCNTLQTVSEQQMCHLISFNIYID